MNLSAIKQIRPPSEDDLRAIAAAKRAGEKLRARKRALGQKLVIWQDGKVVEVSP